MRLKQLRKEAHMTQAELAKELNVAQNTLSNWENGKRQIDLDSLERVANYFNVTMDYLLETSDNPKSENSLCYPLSEDNTNLYIQAVCSLQNARTSILRLFAESMDLPHQDVLKLNNAQLVALIEKTINEGNGFSFDDSYGTYKEFYQSSIAKINSILYDLSACFPL